MQDHSDVRQIEPYASPVYEFRNQLAKETFKWCKERSKFYAKRFEHVDEFRGLIDLPRLPILYRSEIAENLKALICDEGQPACVQYTTGTTGTFLPLFRSHAEVQWIGQFYTARVSEHFRNQLERPLYLALTSTYHGNATPLPGWPYVISAGVYDRTQVDQARRVIETAFDLPGVQSRVSAIVGADVLVKALTAHMMDQGVDLSATSVRHLIFTGGYVSAAVKRKLARLWNASTHDRYSMSEVFGGAIQIGVDGPWVFDVEVMAEVIHPRTHAQVREGVGVLVLTSLYPFSQMTPMLRYYTGDLVEVVDGSSAYEDNLVVRFLGRERRSIIDVESSDVISLVLSGYLHELVEALPDVAASPRYPGVASDLAMEFAGKLHYALDHEKDEHGKILRITITLGLRYAPWIFPERSAQIISDMRAALCSRYPALRERVANGSLRLDIVLTHGDLVAPFSMK